MEVNMRGVRGVISFLIACFVLSSSVHGAKIEQKKKQEESSTFWIVAEGITFILVGGGIYFLVPGEPSQDMAPGHIKNLVKITYNNRINNKISLKNVENPVDNGKQEKIDDKLLDNLGFNEEEKDWIRFLAGEEISDENFPFKSCEAFRQTGNDELKKFKAKKIDYYKLQLESLHNYVQLLFPNLPPGVANKDFYLNRNLNGWKNLLQNCPAIKLKIQNQMKLNLLVMLEFWNFNVDLDKHSEITNISANKESIIFKRGGDHNNLRFTRVLNCLRLFGLHKEHELLFNSVENNNEIMNIINSEISLSESKKFWLETKNVAAV